MRRQRKPKKKDKQDKEEEEEKREKVQKRRKRTKKTKDKYRDELEDVKRKRLTKTKKTKDKDDKEEELLVKPRRKRRMVSPVLMATSTQLEKPGRENSSGDDTEMGMAKHSLEEKEAKRVEERRKQISEVVLEREEGRNCTYYF